MNLFSIAGGIWMAVMSLLGFFSPGGLAPAVPTGSSSAPQVQAVPVQIPASTTPAAIPTVRLPATGSSWQTSLPLGDGRYTTTGPEQGYIYLCNVQTGGAGAQGTGTPPWIHGSTWNPGEKVHVEGSVPWLGAMYAMSVSSSTRTITSNGLPTDHTTGTFPVSPADPAYQFGPNPNSVIAQSYSFSLPAAPTMASTPGCIHRQVGIMDDGVPLYDGFDAAYQDAMAHGTQDAFDGHPDQSGAYHYNGFEDAVMKDTPVSTVVGFAFDGYPITGGKLPDGSYLTSADLDECHGLTSTIMLDGRYVTTYHYVLTQDFPYSVSCFRGASYEPRQGGTGSGS